MRPFQVEICIDSADSAIQAEKLGADRVELCSRLDLDGLTPSYDLMARTRDAISIGLFVMARPREGGFCYQEEELGQMLKTIEQARAIGADGIVAGTLLGDGLLDLKATKQLVRASGNCSFTFHRAFDVCKGPLNVLQQLEELGADRVLSSGQASTAIEGISVLEQLKASAKSIGIMAGSGVNAANIPELWKAGIRQFHFTSHQLNEKGETHFDKSKTIAALETLERL